MTSRRDFLKGFAALASGLALAPATALASVQRLGTPQQWADPRFIVSRRVPPGYVVGFARDRFTVFASDIDTARRASPYIIPA